MIKRDGKHQKVNFDKITSRIDKLCYGLDRRYVDPVVVAQKVPQHRVGSCANAPLNLAVELAHVSFPPVGVRDQPCG